MAEYPTEVLATFAEFKDNEDPYEALAEHLGVSRQEAVKFTRQARAAAARSAGKYTRTIDAASVVDDAPKSGAAVAAVVATLSLTVLAAVVLLGGSAKAGGGGGGGGGGGKKGGGGGGGGEEPDKEEEQEEENEGQDDEPSATPTTYTDADVMCSSSEEWVFPAWANSGVAGLADTGIFVEWGPSLSYQLALAQAYGVNEGQVPYYPNADTSVRQHPYNVALYGSGDLPATAEKLEAQLAARTQADFAAVWTEGPGAMQGLNYGVLFMPKLTAELIGPGACAGEGEGEGNGEGEGKGEEGEGKGEEGEGLAECFAWAPDLDDGTRSNVREDVLKYLAVKKVPEWMPGESFKPTADYYADAASIRAASIYEAKSPDDGPGSQGAFGLLWPRENGGETPCAFSRPGWLALRHEVRLMFFAAHGSDAEYDAELALGEKL